jgi:hypothetical protein
VNARPSFLVIWKALKRCTLSRSSKRSMMAVAVSPGFL